MASYTAEQVIAAYVEVLRELASLKGPVRAPEAMLPLPKDEMFALLHSSTHPNKQQFIRLLDGFESGARTRGLFVGRLTARPMILTLAYAVAIAVQGASWLWVPIALLGFIGAGIATRKWAWFERWAEMSKMKRWSSGLLFESAEVCAVACWGAIWVRLVIISGLYGLYRSVWVRPDGWGIFAALLSLVLGYFFSKQFNAFFFFVTQYSTRHQFRREAGASQLSAS